MHTTSEENKTENPFSLKDDERIGKIENTFTDPITNIKRPL